MNRYSRARRIALALLSVLAAACAPADPKAAETRQVQSTTAARETLRVFLEAQRADSYLRETVNTLSIEECDPVGAVEPRYWLADARILRAVERADTTLVSAEILTIASEEGDSWPDGRVVSIGATRDTATWRLVAAGPAHRWRVCGISVEGVDFAPFGDTLRIRWRNPTESMQRARAVLDSARRSWRAEP